jgi:uncharacterized protein involved in outer membrane biogenesis
MSKARKGVLAALGSLAFLLVALATYVTAGDHWNWLRGPVERLVERSTGRQFRIDGDLRIDLMPNPHVVLENIRFANPSWAAHRWLLQGRRVGFTLERSALLRGNVEISELSLDGARLALERNAQGEKSWTLDESTRPQTSRLPGIGRLSVSNGTVRYDDASTDTSLVVWLDTNGSSGRLPTSFSAQGTYRGKRLHAEGYAGAVLSSVDTVHPFPIRGVVQIGSTRAAIEGAVTDLATFSRARLHVTLEGRDLAHLHPLFPIRLPKTRPYAIEGTLVREGEWWQLRDFTGRIGKSDLSGAIRYEPSGANERKPKLTGRLQSARLDLTDLAGFLGKDPGPERKRGHDRVLPSAPYKADGIRAISVDVRFRGREVLRPRNVPLQDVAARLVINDGLIRLDPLDFGIADGNVVATIGIDATHSPLRASLRAEARRLQLARLLPNPSGKKGGDARVGGTIDLRGVGNSVADFLGSANGAMTFVSSGGTVSSLMVELAGLDFGEALVVLLGGDEPVAMRCGVASFSVERGVMKSELLVLDTSDTVIVGSGRVDLADERLALTLRPQAKDPSVLSGRSPIRIDGTFSEPRLHPDRTALAVRGAAAVLLGLINPLAALIPLVETGTGEDAHCSALLAAAQERQQREGKSTKTAGRLRPASSVR